MARNMRFGVQITGDDKGAVRAMRNVGQQSRQLDSRLEKTSRRTRTVSNRFSGWAQSMKRTVSSISPLKTLLGGLGLAATAEGFRRLTTSVVAAGNAIDKAAQTAGTTTTQLQELRFGLGQLSNLTTPDIDSAFRRFNRRLGLAREGSGALNGSLEKLNITTGQKTPQALERTLDTLGSIESDSRRAALASRAFGEDAGPALAGALSQGTAALREQRQVAQDLGLVLTEDGI